MVIIVLELWFYKEIACIYINEINQLIYSTDTGDDTPIKRKRGAAHSLFKNSPSSSRPASAELPKFEDFVEPPLHSVADKK